MEQPNAGSFWKDRYASHPGAGAEEPKSSFRDYWDQQRAGVQQGNAERKASNLARRDAGRADRAARRGGGGFGGVQPMGGHHGGPTPVIADGGGYGPPPEMSPTGGQRPSPGHGLGPSNLPQGPSKSDPGWVNPYPGSRPAVPPGSDPVLVNPYPGSRPAVPPPGAGVSLGSGATMDGPQRPQTPAPGGGMMTPGITMNSGPQPVPARGAPGGRGGPPPAMAPGGGSGGYRVPPPSGLTTNRTPMRPVQGPPVQGPMRIDGPRRTISGQRGPGFMGVTQQY
jgi:hypothetical protein